MRLAELLGCRVHDANGDDIGGVHDVRFTVHYPGDGGLPVSQVSAIIVGSGGIGHRLGYARREMAGPWPLTTLFQHLSGRSYVVGWADVERFERPRIDLARRVDELSRLRDEQAGESA